MKESFLNEDYKDILHSYHYYASVLQAKQKKKPVLPGEYRLR